MLSAVPLLSGVNCFEVEVDDGINPVTATVWLVQRTVAPPVYDHHPRRGYVADDLTIAKNADSDLTDGFTYTVEVQLAAANDIDGRVELRLSTPGLGLLNHWVARLPKNQQASSFDDISLPLAADLQFQAIYTDALGNTSTSGTSDVELTDVTGPQLILAVPDDGSHLRRNAGRIAVQLVDTGASGVALDCDIALPPVDTLGPAQQAALERWVEAGGGWVGVHAAADAFYDWPWYGELVGAWFRAPPARPAGDGPCGRSGPSVDRFASGGMGPHR